MSSSTIINIPTDPKVFERNCVPLFASVINDPNVKKFGTDGKPQFGLDLIGKRDRDPTRPVGIQCKLITRGGKLTETIIRAEVAKALALVPELAEFYLVTTANDETAYDLLAMTLSAEQAKLGRTIDIQIWGWDSLQNAIRGDAKALAAFDPDYSASTARLLDLGQETVAGNTQIVSQTEQILTKIDLLQMTISTGPLDTARSVLDQHLDMQIDQYRDLMEAGKPRTALELLERLDSTIDNAGSRSIRARVKANIAIALLRLGDEERSAALLAEAYALNPDDPKTRANNILALALQGDLVGAWAFATAVLREDTTNAGAAALAFQVAALSSEVCEPLDIVPQALLDDRGVRIHRISYLRQKSTSESWWALAAETLERFPEDGNTMRLAGDALLDAALSEGTVDRRRLVSDAKRADLARGAELLQSHWDAVRFYENAAQSTWIMISYNLITAYRALGDLDRAATISAQMLALESGAPQSFMSAAWLATDRGDHAEAARLFALAPDAAQAIVPRLATLSNLQDWTGVLREATADRRAQLSSPDLQLFDVLVFRAERNAGPPGDLDGAVERLLERWPLSLAAHIAVGEIYQRERPDAVAAIATKAKSLITPTSAYADRVMFAQLSLFRDAWDDIIAVLDGHVALDRPTEQLAWLAFAFANATRQTRAPAFFQSLAPEILAQPRYARLAGAAEHNRGDLKSAERYLAQAIAADPSDLRALLLMASTLTRDNRESEALDLLGGVDDDTIEGSPHDLMRLAHRHRRAGEAVRALRLGFRVASTNRQDQEVVTAYPALLLADDRLPAPIGQDGPAQDEFWFRLEGLDGVHDITGILDTEAPAGIDAFGPDHPIRAALRDKEVGDEIVMPAQFGRDRRYRLHTLKHKYIWLLHNIMETNAARFPDNGTMFEMTVSDDDVENALDVVRQIQGQDDLLANLYADSQTPISLIAALANKPMLALAEQIAMAGVTLRTCIGAAGERLEAARFVRDARGMGAVLDTLTMYQLHQLGHLAAAKAFFGRLRIARSSFDDMLDLRGRIELNRGRAFMTLEFEGEQALRHDHTVEDTEKKLAWINGLIADIETQCDILPVDGTHDIRYDKEMGSAASAQVFDPVNLARGEQMLLLSEDLNLRQIATQHGVPGGAWLQITLNVFAAEQVISERDYLIAVGMLGALRHGHLWLDAPTLLRMLALDDARAFGLFQAAIGFMGGPKADMPSHISVVVDVMRGIWAVDLPHWQRGRAIGCLLDQLVRSRPQDWKAVLYVIDLEFADRGDRFSRLALDYFEGWVIGHFHNLAEIRSIEHVRADIATRSDRKRTKGRRRKRDAS